MFPFAILKEKIGNALTNATWAAIGAFAALVALIFFSLALFLWLASLYGAVIAALVLGAAYLVVAGIAAIVLTTLRRREIRRQEALAAARRAQSGLIDPALLAAGLEIAKTLGVRRLGAIAVLGALIAALALARPSGGSNPEPPKT